MYLTQFNAEIDISSHLDVDKILSAIEILKNYIKANQGLDINERISIEKDTMVMYIDLYISDEEEIMEKFACTLYKYLVPDEDLIIECQGEDYDDRWDIVIKNDGVYIQEYKREKGDLIKYEQN